VTTSAGVSIYPAHGDHVESLMKSADTALYEAKSAGKNAYRISRQTKLSAVS
jgi:two-component system cell cycle response regulator